jgi:hypothetical protein
MFIAAWRVFFISALYALFSWNHPTSLNMAVERTMFWKQKPF